MSKQFKRLTTEIEVNQLQKDFIDDTINLQRAMWNKLVEVYNPIFKREKFSKSRETEMNEFLKEEFKAAPTVKDIVGKTYKKAPEGSELRKMQYLDMHQWMPGDILLKADKMAIFHKNFYRCLRNFYRKTIFYIEFNYKKRFYLYHRSFFTPTNLA